MPIPTSKYNRCFLFQQPVSAIPGERFAFYERPHLVSVKRSIRSERPEAVLFERSEFTDDSERRMRSSEADVALIFGYFLIKRKVTFKYDNK
ncbi:hypothetical protein DXA15_04075 [Parabacteroides sp. AM58-2XD]|nr:hypothetical protein DXA15_04075 [Parabacteroides sp. AM58-2XD]